MMTILSIIQLAFSLLSVFGTAASLLACIAREGTFKSYMAVMAIMLALCAVLTWLSWKELKQTLK